MNKQNNNLNNSFQLVSNFKPSGDQPQAIEELIKGLNNNEKDQVLLCKNSKCSEKINILKSIVDSNIN